MSDQVLDWLLEKENPSVRYFALRDLLGRPKDDRELKAARRAIMTSPPVQSILAAQHPDGYWSKPGGGYGPKYQGTDWQILFLAELGADGANRQVRQGCEYLLEHAQAAHGGISLFGKTRASGAVYCLNGNLIWALIALGYDRDERVARAVEWLAGAITEDDSAGFAHPSTWGPNFRCAANDKLPCAWGAVKVLRALASLPATWQSPSVRKAKQMAVEFLLSRDLARADYPYPRSVSGEWFKFGFPLSYTSDVLEALDALAAAGCGHDPRLEHAREFVVSQRGADGRWKMRHSLNGKMWADFEVKGQPSKWVTLRAMRALASDGD